jgi:hypothetical protein
MAINITGLILFISHHVYTLSYMNLCELLLYPSGNQGYTPVWDINMAGAAWNFVSTLL